MRSKEAAMLARGGKELAKTTAALASVGMGWLSSRRKK